MANQSPEDEWRRRRFYALLKGVVSKFPSSLFIKGYHCQDMLAKDSVVVDVEQSFTKPQQIKGAAMYFMRFVLHDWPDALTSLASLDSQEQLPSPTSRRWYQFHANLNQIPGFTRYHRTTPQGNSVHSGGTLKD
ncbi:hypothetical protein BC834DRAFT_883609 [Gloeopeniophorella convolvens]|nr:hypothetical protein BC834DRAFT_883609 [Gloeopeniophorella convolvens]